MAVWRAPENPVITPKNIEPFGHGYEVVGAFNAAVTRFDGDILLLLRVAERPLSSHPDIEMTAVYDPRKDQAITKEFHHSDPSIDFKDPRMTITSEGKFLTSLSHFRVARSSDGIHFEIDKKPCMFPSNPYEAYGLEDPRITQLGDTFYITYVAVSTSGVVTCLASTTDFKNFKRHGIIFGPDNKDAFIFPEKVNGMHYAINRPVTPLFEKYNIWLSESPDLISWGNHRHIISPSQNHWDHARVGGSVVPFRIKEGWLLVYHGVDVKNRYTQGAALLEANEPWDVVARSHVPFLEPEMNYEMEGFFGNVVFTCGLLYEEKQLHIYYGVADTSLAYAQIPLEDVMNTLEPV